MKPHPPLRRIALAAACAIGSLTSLNAAAFEIDTGNPDLTLRFDNSLRLNLAVRAEARDSKIGNSALADEGTFSFDQGDFVAQRIDLLSEFDLVWKKRHGLRLSGTAWYDAAYDGSSRSNPTAPLANIPSYAGNRYSPTVKRLYRGGTGEILDAFAFGAVDLGEVPVKAKLGRHTVYWGESLFLGGHLHSVAYAQNPLDLQKGFATPGTEAKELFRPLNQLSLQAQLTDTLSLAATYGLQWEPARYPEGGTYLGPVDFVFNGPDRQFLSAAAGFAMRGAASEPRQRGEWGLAARWSPDWLDGTLGVYARRYADKLPQTLLHTRGAASTSVYHMVYADRVDLYGVSLAKSVGGISIGAEVSTRRNTPLTSQVLGFTGGVPAQGQTLGARGDTWHALVNLLGVSPKSALWDQATWGAELQASRWSRVRSGAALFNALGFAPCNGRDRFDGCVTKDYVGASVAFTPTWYQVLPGVDLSAPLTYAVGLSGNAAVVFGGNERLGNYTVGLSADVRQSVRIDLKYVDYVGRYKDNGLAVTSTNGLTTFLKDRGFVSLTLRTTF